jgi:hypothetical protein
MKAPSARRPTLARPLSAIRVAGRHARLVGNVAQFQQDTFQISRRQIELESAIAYSSSSSARLIARFEFISSLRIRLGRILPRVRADEDKHPAPPFPHFGNPAR